MSMTRGDPSISHLLCTQFYTGLQGCSCELDALGLMD